MQGWGGAKALPCLDGKSMRLTEVVAREERENGGRPWAAFLLDLRPNRGLGPLAQPSRLDESAASVTTNLFFTVLNKCTPFWEKF